MRWLLALALVAPAFAGDEAKAPKPKETPPLQRIDPRLKLPTSKGANKDEGGYGVVVNLDAEGRLAAGDKRCTLKELEKLLEGAVKKHGEFEGKASTMRVLLRLDAGAPWIHAQWLLLTCAKQKVGRAEIAVRRADGTPGYLKAWLPIDAGVGGLQAAPARVRLHVIARAEKVAAYGEQKVHKPTSFVYRVGAAQSEKLDDVGAQLERERLAARKAKLEVRGELQAGAKVPMRCIVTAMDQFRARKFEDIDFHGAALPSTESIQAKRLPYPTRNYGVQ